jgi:hypothetical protein
VVALGLAETDHIADSGTARSSVSLLTPQSPAADCAKTGPWRLQEHHCAAVLAQRPGCCIASLRYSPGKAVAGRCSFRVPGRILKDRLVVAVDLVELSEGLQAAVDVEEYRSDRIAHRSDSTHPVRIQPEPEGIRPGIPETKRQKMRPPAEVLALQEGLQALGIAAKDVSYAVCCV